MHLSLMMISRLLPFVSAASIATQATAQASFVDESMVLVEYGVYCPYDIIGKTPAPDTISGETDHIDNVILGDLSTKIPAIQGFALGMFYYAKDNTRAYDFVLTLTHPPLGPNGRTEQSWSARVREGKAGQSTWQFDDPEDMALGEWMMELSLNGKVVIRQMFEVVPAAQAPAALSTCLGDEGL
jgi:hypothetical protein